MDDLEIDEKEKNKNTMTVTNDFGDLFFNVFCWLCAAQCDHDDIAQIKACRINFVLQPTQFRMIERILVEFSFCT